MGMDSAAVQGAPVGRLTSLAELTEATLPASGGLREDSVMDDKALCDHLLGLTCPWTDTADARTVEVQRCRGAALGTALRTLHVSVLPVGQDAREANGRRRPRIRPWLAAGGFDYAPVSCDESDLPKRSRRRAPRPR
jgi:hypothetical protein